MSWLNCSNCWQGLCCRFSSPPRSILGTAHIYNHTGARNDHRVETTSGVNMHHKLFRRKILVLLHQIPKLEIHHKISMCLTLTNSTQTASIVTMPSRIKTYCNMWHIFIVISDSFQGAVKGRSMCLLPEKHKWPTVHGSPHQQSPYYYNPQSQVKNDNFLVDTSSVSANYMTFL